MISLLIHGFLPVNARLLIAFGTAFYAIIALDMLCIRFIYKGLAPSAGKNLISWLFACLGLFLPFWQTFFIIQLFSFPLKVYDRIASVPDNCIQELNVVFVPHLTMAYKETCCARMCIMHCYSFQGVRVQS